MCQSDKRRNYNIQTTRIKLCRPTAEKVNVTAIKVLLKPNKRSTQLNTEIEN